MYNSLLLCAEDNGNVFPVGLMRRAEKFFSSHARFVLSYVHHRHSEFYPDGCYCKSARCLPLYMCKILAPVLGVGTL